MFDFDSILQRLRSDFQSVFSESNPYRETGFLKAILYAFAGRFLDLEKKLQEFIRQAFISTSTGEFTTKHGTQYGITPGAATKASGNISAIGVLTTSIPANSILVSQDGIQIETDSGAVISLSEVSISSITVSNGVATATATNHQLFTSNEVVISGANEADFNGTFTVQSIDADTFTFPIVTAESSATGTIIFSINRAIILCNAIDEGVNGNLLPNQTIEFSQTIPNVNSTAGVIFNGFSDGSDNQAPLDYKNEILDRVRNPVAPFNDANIKQTVRDTVSTATRIFVHSTTPQSGFVTIYFVEDGNSNILPSSQSLSDAKSALIEIKSADIDEDDILVLAPTLVPVDFVFSTISPNTSSMRDAIAANLEFFFTQTSIAKTDNKILFADINNVIINTIDDVLGQNLESYTLTIPTGDINLANNELGTLGNVTFN